MCERLRAYVGEEHYIFVSYLRSNPKETMEDILFLQNEGYRVWFDEGINAGDGLGATLTHYLQNSAHYIIFISKEWLTRDYGNKRNYILEELTYIRNNGRRIIPVLMDDVQLPEYINDLLGDTLYIRRTDADYKTRLLRSINSKCNDKMILDIDIPDLKIYCTSERDGWRETRQSLYRYENGRYALRPVQKKRREEFKHFALCQEEDRYILHDRLNTITNIKVTGGGNKADEVGQWKVWFVLQNYEIVGVGDCINNVW